MQIPFFYKEIRKRFYKVLGISTSAISFLLYFFEIDKSDKCRTLGLICIGFFLVYVWIWLRAKSQNKITLKINSSTVEVLFGDIFKENADLKVIAFNEYFDTQVDDIIISNNSLNGQYIKRFYQDKVNELDSIISDDTHLAENKVPAKGIRKTGKSIKYKLGTICVDSNNYLLTALTHFDSDNKAYLTINDYLDFLFNFWKEIDRVYAGRTVALPVLGTGITRFRNYHTTDQELLELILWTFKMSNVKFTYPAKLKIIVYSGKRNVVNLLRLQDLAD